MAKIARTEPLRPAGAVRSPQSQRPPVEALAMGMTVLIVEDSPRDPRRHHKKPKQRQTRAEIRSRAYVPPVDSLEDEEELTHFLSFHPAASELPMLSRWDPAGRPWCHTPDEVEWIAAEVERALLQIDPGSRTGEMLEQLLGLARRAIAQDLLMEVAPD